MEKVDQVDKWNTQESLKNENEEIREIIGNKGFPASINYYVYTYIIHGLYRIFFW